MFMLSNKWSKQCSVVKAKGLSELQKQIRTNNVLYKGGTNHEF